MHLSGLANDIVAIWILNEGVRVIRNFVHKLDSLVIGRVVDAPLEDTATVPVGRHLDTVCRYRIVNKLKL